MATGELLLRDVRVPSANVIGEVGGFRLAMLGLNSMRPIVAARGIGLAEGALMYATEYVREREAFGQTIADFQGIQWEIAKLATEIEAARLRHLPLGLAGRPGQVHQGAALPVDGQHYATELAVKASNVSLQMLGAAGYMKDHMTELYYRDAVCSRSSRASSQVQLGLIGRGDQRRPLWIRPMPDVSLDAVGGWPAELALSAHQDLTADVAEAAMAAILDGGASPAQIAGFIVALRMKGETVEELSGLLRSMLAASERGGAQSGRCDRHRRDRR